MTATTGAADLDPAGLARLVAAVEPGAEVERVVRLGGGLAAATCAITLQGAHGVRRLVLKRYDERDAAQLEWDRLGAATRVSLPTPDPVAIDAAGEWFGEPALLMTALPGRVDLAPRDLDRWTAEIARALVAIHATRIGSDAAPALHRPHFLAQWKLWDIARDTRIDAATKVIAQLQRDAPNERTVFCHDDFHPGNVLFEGDTLTAVVDWSGARFAPAAVDVAHCRADIAIAPGGDAPALVLAHYERLAGAPLDTLPAWDVLMGMNVLQWGDERWVKSYADEGVTLTVDDIQSAALGFIDDALVRCGADAAIPS